MVTGQGAIALAGVGKRFEAITALAGVRLRRMPAVPLLAEE
jgi:hypothetical protein